MEQATPAEGSAAPSSPTTDSTNLLSPHKEVSSNDKAEASTSDKPEQNEAKEVTKPVDDKFASKFAALSKKERALLQREQELKARLKEVEERERPLTEYQKRQALKKENPLKYLTEEGLSYDDITKSILSGGELPPESKYKTLEEKLLSLENELKRRDELVEKTQLESKLNTFKTEIKEVITKNENYELIRAFNSEDVVYNVIEQHFIENKKLLSIEEAADLVEDYLQKDVEENANKLRQTKKAQKYFAPSAAPEPANQSKQQESTQATPGLTNTLTNQQSTEAIERGKRPLTVEESMLEAAKLLRWEK